MVQANLQIILRALSIGDAFGAGVEFQDRGWIRANVDFREESLFEYCIKNIVLDEVFCSYLVSVSGLPEYDELTEADFEVLCGPQPIQAPYFLPGIKGMPSDSMYTAGCVLYILRESKNALNALRKSVLIGGDVDSVASITTAIMAGKYGLGSLPDFLLKNTEKIPDFDNLRLPVKRWKLA